ncbi:GNAT family N-acetyltransferase [Plebeiibacterium marinum]|uniref:GNAT family N-acetyltransferase n=1 Tax=Plebeiibacterium marinum TaxID=2992111 RepID=A0AAE3SIY1_9BACT|nr:GNAT family N-acetyltransferase [Plebeiobacterium marinum]MCW3804863.1 GNAT family N-acetyltransferase [Plebeiobacterium marinum]
MEKLIYTYDVIDLKRKEHRDALVSLMNDYMLDEMGLGRELSEDLADKIISGLQKQNNYIGFLLKTDKKYVALANCFVGFSTFKAKKLLNIHDFVVTPEYRKRGAGYTLLNKISEYSRLKDFCKVTLEVRDDNFNAMNLYKKTGFQDCNPRMYFWENLL